MRKYEDKEKVIVKKRECVKHLCDMCGRKAESPEQDGMSFEWGGVGLSAGNVTAEYLIDGEYDHENIDLCYECADWLIEQIRSRRIKRPDDI